MTQGGLAVYEDRLMLTVLAIFGVIIAILFLILAGAIAVRLLRTFCIQRLTYRRYFMKELAAEGEENQLVEEFSNHSFLPMFFVDVETHISSRIVLQNCQADDKITQRFISRFFVMPFTRIRRIHKVICEKRGYYQLETAKINFMGLEFYLDSKAELSVYPKALRVEEEHFLNSQLQYSVQSKFPLLPDPFSFAGLRPYVHGDSLSMLNYKQTAMRGELMVNKCEYRVGRKIKIYLNFQPDEGREISKEEFDEILEQEMSYAAYLLGICAKEGYRYSMTANCKMTDGRNQLFSDFCAGAERYRELLGEMAKMRNLYGVSMLSVLNHELETGIEGTEIFLFTAYMDKKLEIAVADLERAGNAVTVTEVTSCAKG